MDQRKKRRKYLEFLVDGAHAVLLLGGEESCACSSTGNPALKLLPLLVAIGN